MALIRKLLALIRRRKKDTKMIPYPETMPQEAMQIVWDVFRGNSIDVPAAVHAGWETLGYALGRVVPGQSMMMATLPDDSSVDEAFQNVLGSNGQDMVGFSPLIWQIIIKIALGVLTKHLGT